LGRGGFVGSFLAVNGVEDLLAMDGHLLGCHDAQPHLVAADLHHGYDDVVVDDDTFVFFFLDSTSIADYPSECQEAEGGWKERVHIA